MFKKLVTFVIVLGLVSVASAIQQFEYKTQGELDLYWEDVSTNDQGVPGTSSVTVTLLQGGFPTVASGGGAVHVDFDIPGGWDKPDDHEDLTMSDRARVAFKLTNEVDVSSFHNPNTCPSGFALSFYIKPTTDNLANLGDLNIYGEGPDGQSRTILPCPMDEHFQWWFPPEWVPACLGDVEQFDDWLANAAWHPYAAEYVAKDFIGVGKWAEVTITTETQIGPIWGWGNIQWEDHTALDTIIIECNVDQADFTAKSRFDSEGVEIYPIVGGTYGFDFDAISLVCLPEPATIALLGLGGLALLRVLRKR